MKLITSIRQTVAQFLTALTALTTAIEANTTATAALLETSKRIEAAAAATQRATAYLSASERHKREQSGQRSEFGA